MRRSTAPATLAILAFSVIWGVSYLWMKTPLGAAEDALGEGAALAAVAFCLVVRFTIGALVLLFVPAARRGLGGPGVWRGGWWLGSLLMLGFVLQLIGLRGMDPAVSAFLTSLYVVFTALVVRLYVRRPVAPRLVGGALLATVGAAWISGPPDLNFDWPEWLTVASALVFAVHIVATDVITRRVEALPVTVTSLVVVSVLSLALAALTLEGRWTAAVQLLGDREFMTTIALSAVFATALAIALMNRWQKELPPVRAAILYALEPVWAALFAVSLHRAEATAWLWFGGGCLLAGNLFAELGPGAARDRAG